MSNQYDFSLRVLLTNMENTTDFYANFQERIQCKTKKVESVHLYRFYNNFKISSSDIVKSIAPIRQTRNNPIIFYLK